MKTSKFNEKVSFDNIEISDWDPADDFGSEEEMRGFLELAFSDNNSVIMLDAMDAVARAKGYDQVVQQINSIKDKNLSQEIINKILNDIGFFWNNQIVSIIK
jgi:DNA-binding phage protein